MLLIYRIGLFIKFKFDKVRESKLLSKKVWDSFLIKNEREFLMNFYSEHSGEFGITAIIYNDSVTQGVTDHMIRMVFIYRPNQEIIHSDKLAYNLNPRVLKILNNEILPTLNFEEYEN